MVIAALATIVSASASCPKTPANPNAICGPASRNAIDPCTLPKARIALARHPKAFAANPAVGGSEPKKDAHRPSTSEPYAADAPAAAPTPEAVEARLSAMDTALREPGEMAAAAKAASGGAIAVEGDTILTVTETLIAANNVTSTSGASAIVTTPTFTGAVSLISTTVAGNTGSTSPLALFGGMLFLCIYILVSSARVNGDLKALLIGEGRAAA